MTEMTQELRRTQISEALKSYRTARIEAEEAKHRQVEAEAKLLELLESAHQKTASTREGDKTFRATYVRTETVNVNEDSLKKALGARKFYKYTVRKLDKKLLEEGMIRGEVDAGLVSQHVEIKQSRPWIRYTEGPTKNDSDPEGS